MVTNRLCVCLQQTVGLVQLTIELLRVGHLQTSSHDLQEQLLRACVLFLDEAYHLRPECTQVYMDLLLLLLLLQSPIPSVLDASC